MRGPFTRPFQGHSHFCWSACLKLLDFNSALFVNLSWANSLVLSSVNLVFDLLNTDWKKSFCKEPLLNKNVTVSFWPFYLPMFTNTGAVLWIWLVILHAAAVQRLWGNALIYYWPWRWVCCLEAQMLERSQWENVMRVFTRSSITHSLECVCDCWQVRQYIVQVVFSVTFAFSCTMFELIIFEILGALSSR